MSFNAHLYQHEPYRPIHLFNLDAHVTLLLNVIAIVNIKQELSYRKQIARQLHKH